MSPFPKMRIGPISATLLGLWPAFEPAGGGLLLHIRQELASAMSDSSTLRALLDSSPLSGGNAPYVESLYEQYLDDPTSVEPAWRDYFKSLGGGNDAAH